MSYLQSLGYVTALMEAMDVDVDEAIRRAKIPEDVADWIRSELAPPVSVTAPPVVISEAQKIKYCAAPEVPNPSRHYLAGFENFVIDHRKWSRRIVIDGESSLRAVSRLLVQHLPDPRANSRPFDAKGLVLGYVQSGKTGNMAALICRAADQGYRMLIVLAGLYNDLREQTQRRLDQDVVGRSDDDEGPFVSHAQGLARWGRLTKSGLPGDFQAGTIGDISPESPKLAVMKKHPRVLERFVQWIEQNPELKKLPTLIIDDEADQASINSNYGKVDDEGEAVDPTATNQAIRNLIATFPQRAYVGFTATPFANVLIDAGDEADLFPSDFIVSLHEPPGYFGARQLFGLGMSSTALSPESAAGPELDVIRSVSQDDQQALASVEGDDSCPDSLRGALLSFVLSCAARLKRGQGGSHFSMLVHPSGRRDDHRAYASVLKSDIERLKTQLPKLRMFPALKAELKLLWEKDFVPTSEAAGESRVAFSAIAPLLPEAIDQLQVKLIHQGSPDVLTYNEKVPQRYVVVGGNRLSRGLTLEGLSVSFFVRTASYYDTLLQMGRWFGYRNGYADLTRIFVDDQTAEAFADLARIELELRADLDKYRDGKTKPRELVPLIREHHRLDPTSPNKHGAAGNIGPILRNVKQVVRFPFESSGALEANVKATREFVASLGAPDKRARDWWLWRKQSKEKVLEFISTYQFAAVPVLNRTVLTQAIESLESKTTWDIVIPQESKKDGFEWVKGRSTVMLNRAPLTASSIKVLREASDVSRWREEKSRAKAAILLYVVNPQFAPGRLRFRRTDQPLVAPTFVFPEEDLRDKSFLKRLPPPGYIAQPNLAKAK